MKQITITDVADQQFAVILENRRVTMRVRYNVTNDSWSFDLSIDDLPVLQGRKIVTGIDLLAPFNLGIGVIFAAAVTSGATPNRQQLPNGEVRLYHTTETEIDAAISA